MPARVFDWRDDPSGTMIAVPEVRARFLRHEPNATDRRWHSHVECGGYETWVVLEGAVQFDFEDRTVVATKGQAVVALPHEKHRVSCYGDEPCVYFLTVTPHRSPTHTFYDENGQPLPTQPGVTNPTWRGQPAMGSQSSG